MSPGRPCVQLIAGSSFAIGLAGLRWHDDASIGGASRRKPLSAGSHHLAFVHQTGTAVLHSRWQLPAYPIVWTYLARRLRSRPMAARQFMTPNRPLNGRKKVFRARLDSLHGNRNIGIAGEEYDRRCRAALAQAVLQLQAAQGMGLLRQDDRQGKSRKPDHWRAIARLDVAVQVARYHARVFEGRSRQCGAGRASAVVPRPCRPSKPRMP